MKRSPLQLSNLSPEMKGIALQAKLTGRLVQIHEEFLDNMDEIRDIIVEARSLSKEGKNQLARINKLPKGDKGDRGPSGFGIQGKPGKDGESPDPLEIAQLVTALLPKEVPEVEKPEDEEEETKAMVSRVLEALNIDEKFKKVYNEMASYRNQMAQPLAGKTYGKNTWARGGGSSGGGAGVEIETPVGAVNAVNVTYTVSAIPLWVTADGIQYFENAGYTLAGLTITMDIPPSQYIRAAVST